MNKLNIISFNVIKLKFICLKFIIKLVRTNDQRISFEMNEDFAFLSGIGTMTWSPLACGLLSGKYDDGVPLHSRAALKVTRNEEDKKENK